MQNPNSQEKLSRIVSINQEKQSPPCRLMLELLNILVAEERVINDRINPSELCFHQGRIDAFKQLKRVIENGTNIC